MSKGRILVVDDEENVRITLEAILQLEKYEVTGASGVVEALAALKSADYDLVLTDLRMDDGDGTQILAFLREHKPKTIAIVMTGFASLESAIQVLREGAYDYIIKPADVEVMKTTVARGMERALLGRQLQKRVQEVELANQKINELNQGLQTKIDLATAELRENVIQLKELDVLKNQFLSIASHELRTPITSVSGYIQIAVKRLEKRLLAGPPKEEEEWRQEATTLLEQMRVVQKQTYRFSRLVTDLLDVSKIHAGRLDMKVEPVEIDTMLEQLIAGLDVATTREIVLEKENAPVTMQGDEQHLEQVFTNLLTNALKYSPPTTPVRVFVSCDQDTVRVRVRDYGIGIAPEERTRVFGLFYRSLEREAKDVGGLGLGLYISKDIVEKHNGKIWVEPADPGTVFIVELPR